MAAQQFKYHPVNINLLPGITDFEKTSWGKFLKWALSIGRYIIVFTELIVILAFLSRFKFDRDLTDLHEAIEQKKSIVSSASTFESNFRNLQSRLKAIEKLDKEQIAFENLLKDFSSFTPVDVTISNLSISRSSITLGASSLSEAGLATIIYQLRNSPKFSDISLGNVSKGKNLAEIQFSITALLTPAAFN